MVAEKQLDEFVSRMQKAAGENLHSVILYGSAAAGDYNPEFSNLNLLCILRETSFSKLSAVRRVVEWWYRQKHPAPLVMTEEELEEFLRRLLDRTAGHAAPPPRALWRSHVVRAAHPHEPAPRASRI